MKKSLLLALLAAALFGSISVAGAATFRNHPRTPIACFRSYGWHTKGTNDLGSATKAKATVNWLHAKTWQPNVYFIWPNSRWHTLIKFTQVLVCLRFQGNVGNL